MADTKTSIRTMRVTLESLNRLRKFKVHPRETDEECFGRVLSIAQRLEKAHSTTPTGTLKAVPAKASPVPVPETVCNPSTEVPPSLVEGGD